MSHFDFRCFLQLSIYHVFCFRLKEQRNAAFELASLAATGEEAKHKIVQNGGYVLIIELAENILTLFYKYKFLTFCLVSRLVEIEMRRKNKRFGSFL